MQKQELEDALKWALANLEGKITVDSKPGDGLVRVARDDIRHYSQKVPVWDFTNGASGKKLDEAMSVLARGINSNGKSISTAGLDPPGVEFAEVACGSKVYLRMVVFFHIESNEFVAQFCVISVLGAGIKSGGAAYAD